MNSTFLQLSPAHMKFMSDKHVDQEKKDFWDYDENLKHKDLDFWLDKETKLPYGIGWDDVIKEQREKKIQMKEN